jgi:hypothetical protein
MNRRSFLHTAATSYLVAAAHPSSAAPDARPLPKGTYHPGRIENEYSLFLAGEKEALVEKLEVTFGNEGAMTATVAGASQPLKIGQSISGWQLVTVAEINGTATAVFEKHVTHQGMIVYITESEGEILRIPKRVGQLSSIRPRSVNTPHGVRFTRQVPYIPGPDKLGEYILNSPEDPCYENVAALGAEYIGYTLVANEQAGPLRSLFLEPDGKSRQLSPLPEGQGIWAPDLVDPVFDPSKFLPGEDPSLFEYKPGYSKRTLLGGYLPAANIGVWNTDARACYEVIVLLPPGTDAQPIARLRFVVPS